MRRNKYITVLKKVPIPSWALCYLINADDSGLSPEDKQEVDSWVERTREGGRIDVCCPEEGGESYFHRHPAFGLPSDVEDCDVIVNKTPLYEHCDYPCCGQSRWEPVHRQAMDGKWWWVLYDNKEHKFVRHSQKFKTRRALVARLFIDLKYGNIAYEPDDDRRTLAWLKTQTEIPK